MADIPKIRFIENRQELIALAKELGVRDSWHEPDEQELTARVYGESFDNAMCGTHKDLARNIQTMPWNYTIKDAEMTVVLYKGMDAIAEINLALLLAWACGFEG